MKDDWSPPTAEHAIQRRPRDGAATATNDEIDPVLGVSERDLRIVNAFYHELALDASQDPAPLTPRELVELGKLEESLSRVKSMSEEELLSLRARRLRHLALEEGGKE